MDTLPPSITSLSLGMGFRKPLDNLPAALKILHLKLRKDIHVMTYEPYIRPLDHLPSLTELRAAYDSPADYFPTSLKVLELLHFDQAVDYLPPGLTSLEIHAGTGEFHLDHLPSSLTYFHLRVANNIYKHSLDHLPSSLTDIGFYRNINQPVDHLPSSLTTLVFDDKFNKRIDHLPVSLTSLMFHPDSLFNQPIDYLPPSLTLLELPPNFHFPLDNLPPSLTLLELPPDFHFPLDNLPSSLRALQCEGLHEANSNFLPPSLQTICTIYSAMRDLSEKLPHVKFEELESDSDNKSSSDVDYTDSEGEYIEA
jgi:hypothetical protein